MILSSSEKQRFVNSLSWMIDGLKVGFDLMKGNVEQGSEGGYSDELVEAMCLLDEVKNIHTVESIESHGNSKSCGHRRTVLLNCREFSCVSNSKGVCALTNITLESIGAFSFGRVRCVQASDEHISEEENI